MATESAAKETQDLRFVSAPGSGKDMTTDAKFKKQYQTVTPNEVAGVDINEQGLRDPPQNVPVGQPSTGRGQQYPPVEYEPDEADGEVGKEGPGKGRPKLLDVNNELIEESETVTKP